MSNNIISECTEGFKIYGVRKLYCQFSFKKIYKKTNTYTVLQGLSQDLETGCPKLAIAKILGVLFSKGDHNILEVYSYKYVLLNEIKHYVHIQCHVNYIKVKNIQLYV